jgi:IS5 family transposase
MYFLQVWFNLADEALEESVYDSYAMGKFMRLDYFKEGVPDATTLRAAIFSRSRSRFVRKGLKGCAAVRRTEPPQSPVGVADAPKLPGNHYS